MDRYNQPVFQIWWVLGDKGKGEKHTTELNIKTLGTKKKLDFDFIQKVDSYIWSKYANKDGCQKQKTHMILREKNNNIKKNPIPIVTGPYAVRVQSNGTRCFSSWQNLCISY